MHRFFQPACPPEASSLTLTGSEAHHALKVLRAKVGESVVVLDGQGHTFNCLIESISPHSLGLKVTGRLFSQPPPCPITLWVAVPKAKGMDGIIQKLVELGVARVVPLLTQRVVAQFNTEEALQKREKWHQVACEALKQCGGAWLPMIDAPTPIARILSQPLDVELSLVGALASPRFHPAECFAAFKASHGRKPRGVGIWIGPEGDFTPDELQAICQCGAKPITMGERVLRVETAVICGLSILSHELSAPTW